LPVLIIFITLSHNELDNHVIIHILGEYFWKNFKILRKYLWDSVCRVCRDCMSRKTLHTSV